MRRPMIGVRETEPHGGYLHLVGPRGEIHNVPLWEHVNGTLVRHYVVPQPDGTERSEWRVSPHAHAKGYRELGELYRAETWEAGYDAYCQWWEHARVGKAEPFPDKGLPQAVLDRRPDEDEDRFVAQVPARPEPTRPKRTRRKPKTA